MFVVSWITHDFTSVSIVVADALMRCRDISDHLMTKWSYTTVQESVVADALMPDVVPGYQ